MSIESMIKHVNDEHLDAILGLAKQFVQEKVEIKKAVLKDMDLDGIDILYNDEKLLRVEFAQKCKDEQDIKNALITLCQELPKDKDFSKQKEELELFKKEFGSVGLATITKDGYPFISYAPLIIDEENNQYYIYISEIAEHYENIKNNPNRLDVIFLEDESKAKSIIVRKRARYSTNATFIQRDSKEFDKMLTIFEEKMSGSGGVKTIRNMLDFHLIKLHFIRGRFVKGFGQAYDIKESGDLVHIGSSGNPHKPKKH